MLRSEAGNGEIERKGAKANGSDNAALDGGKSESGNGLWKEFSDTVVARIMPATGAKGDDSIHNEASGSTNSDKSTAASGKGEKPLADGQGTGMRSEAAADAAGARANGEAKRSETAAGERANGTEKKPTDALTGSGKSTISDAFPSNSQLLNQLKV